MKNNSDVEQACFDIFCSKMKDYGASWALFRLESLADQLWIKIKRVRTIEDGGALVDEGVEPEFIGIINYSIMIIMKWRGVVPDLLEGQKTDKVALEANYKKIWGEINELMARKNHDYGEAWRDMHIHAITDQILTKIYRVKSILANDEKLLVSEDIGAQLMDIVNYCSFALIRTSH